MKKLCAVIIVSFLFINCSPTVQVTCGGNGDPKGTLSNTETPTVEVLREPRAALQSPGAEQGEL